MEKYLILINKFSVLGEKPHACSVCFKEFYDLNSLKSHMVRHKDIGEFQCDQCPKIFKRASYLKEHKRTHTGKVIIKPLEKLQLLIIVTIMESEIWVFYFSGEKPFACNLCHRDFRMKSNYFKHMKIHRRKNEIP